MSGSGEKDIDIFCLLSKSLKVRLIETKLKIENIQIDICKMSFGKLESWNSTFLNCPWTSQLPFSLLLIIYCLGSILFLLAI